MVYELSDMTWPSAESTFSESTVFFLPIGSTEQHGPHLPIGTDYFQAVAIARLIAERCDGVVLPGIPFGYSENHMRFKGSITIPGDTLKAVVNAVCESVFRHGGRRIVLLNSHGGNIPALSLAAQELNGKNRTCKVVNLFWIQLVDQDENLKQVLGQEIGTHADEVETSVMLLLRRELVRIEAAQREIPENILRKKDSTTLRALLGQGVLRIQEQTQSGVLGDPTLATPEKGRLIIDVVLGKGLEFIREAFSTNNPF